MNRRILKNVVAVLLLAASLAAMPVFGFPYYPLRITGLQNQYELRPETSSVRPPQTLRPLFDWANISGATSYNLQIAANETFTVLVLNINVSTSAYRPTSDLPRGVTLYWRVRANGPTGPGIWSATGAFSSPNPPGTPTLLSPANGAMVTELTPTLDWSDSTFAPDHYEVQISTNSSFTQVARGQGGLAYDSRYTLEVPLAAIPTYYWRVRAFGAVSPLGGVPVSEWSAARSFRTSPLPAGDDDGDGLPNSWEIAGYDANNDGIIDVDLPALGANYRHKDIFVEMDYMITPGGVDLGPNQAVIDAVVAVFAAAPIANPDGATGINIHLEKDDPVPYDSYLVIWNELDAIKNVYFDPKRTATHHYMIWANQHAANQSSGVSRGIPATDFIVTVGSWNSQGGTFEQRLGTFVHELGHNLGLTHGGNDHENWKPNYLSVMNYRYVFWGVYRDGSWYNFDYQRFSLPNLNETNLNETTGLSGGGGDISSYGTIYSCNGTIETRFTASLSAIDWNCNGNTQDTGVIADINRDPDPSPYTPQYSPFLGSQNNWGSIVFHGGHVIGSGLAPEILLEQLPDDIPAIEEATLEMYLEIEQQMQQFLQP